MSENDQPPSDGSGLELDRPTKGPTSNPSLHAVRSASRAQPLPAAPAAPKKLTKARLQEGAVDTLLNSVSILSEMMEDFRNSDRFFKYKAGVMATWLVLSLSTFGVACPNQTPANDIDARLVITEGAHGTIYMVKNDSKDVWSVVKVVVNGSYESTLNQVEPGGNLTLSPAVIYNRTTGERAPSDLRVNDIVVEVDEPSAQVHLLRNGQPLQ